MAARGTRSSRAADASRAGRSSGPPLGSGYGFFFDLHPQVSHIAASPLGGPSRTREIIPHERGAVLVT